jgi:hypothetical protein
MSDLFLDLRDQTRVVDFLVEQMDFADDQEKNVAEKIVNDYHEGKRIASHVMAGAARRLARAVWPVRYALDRHFQKEGADVEIKQVCAAVRPSTGHLLSRCQLGRGAETLDELLQQDEHELALRDEEIHEIREVRKQVRLDYWKNKKKALNVYLKEGENELESVLNRLHALRELAEGMSPSLQDEVFSKIERYEDRLLFKGEVLPMELLEDEMRYYRDQKEINPFDE